jgi:hypothetical protein
MLWMHKVPVRGSIPQLKRCLPMVKVSFMVVSFPGCKPCDIWKLYGCDTVAGFPRPDAVSGIGPVPPGPHQAGDSKAVGIQSKGRSVV